MRRMSNFTIILLLIPGAGFIMIFLSAASLMTIVQSFGYFNVTGESEFSLRHWASLVDQQFTDSFFYSLKIGICSAFGTLVLAFPLALFLRKKSYFGVRYIGALLNIPLFVPALVAAFIILNTMSYNGIINVALLRLHLTDEPLRMLRDPNGFGVIFIQIWKNLPFQLLIIASVIQSIRQDVEDAARNLGASYFGVVRHVILPIASPGILIAVVLVFIMTFGDFAINKVAGPNYPQALSVFMYSRATLFQEWNAAAAVGVVIIVTSLAFVGIYTRTIMALRSEAS